MAYLSKPQGFFIDRDIRVPGIGRINRLSSVIMKVCVISRFRSSPRPVKAKCQMFLIHPIHSYFLPLKF